MINANNFRGLNGNRAFDRAMENRLADGIAIVRPDESGAWPERRLRIPGCALLIPENTALTSYQFSPENEEKQWYVCLEE